MPETIRLTVNGTACSVTTDARRPLLDVLREDLKLTGTKYGCGEGMCRACTVLLDGRPTTSCITPVIQAQGMEITTIEGLSDADAEKLHPVQEALMAEGMQCGYCASGMILQAAALLEENPRPTDEEIVEGMGVNMCRCCGYRATLRAIRRAAGRAEDNEEVQIR